MSVNMQNLQHYLLSHQSRHQQSNLRNKVVLNEDQIEKDCTRIESELTAQHVCTVPQFKADGLQFTVHEAITFRCTQNGLPYRLDGIRCGSTTTSNNPRSHFVPS